MIRYRAVFLAALVVAAGTLMAVSAVFVSAALPQEGLAKGDSAPSEAEIAGSIVAQREFGLPSELAARFPDAYGGITIKPNGLNDQWVIQAIDGAAGADDLKALIWALEQDSLSRTGTSIHFDFVSTHAAQSRRDQVREELSKELGLKGPLVQQGMTGVGLNGNGILIFTEDGRGDAIGASVRAAYPDITFEVSASGRPSLAA